jgi:hypothetical protein
MTEKLRAADDMEHGYVALSEAKGLSQTSKCLFYLLTRFSWA